MIIPENKQIQKLQSQLASLRVEEIEQALDQGLYNSWKIRIVNRYLTKYYVSEEIQRQKQHLEKELEHQKWSVKLPAWIAIAISIVTLFITYSSR